MKNYEMSEIEQLVDTGYVYYYYEEKSSELGDDYISPRAKAIADNYLLIPVLLAVFEGVHYGVSKLKSLYSLSKDLVSKKDSVVKSSVSDYVSI